MISKTHIEAQKPCGRQLNAKVCSSKSAIFAILSSLFNNNNSSTHCGFSTKLPLISGGRSTNTQHLHNFNWIKVKNYVCMCTCLVARPQIAAFGLRTRLVHGISVSTSSSLQVVGQRAIHNTIDKYVGKMLLTAISCKVRFVALCFTIEFHVQALPVYSPSHPMPWQLTWKIYSKLSKARRMKVWAIKQDGLKPVL